MKAAMLAFVANACVATGVAFADPAGGRLATSHIPGLRWREPVDVQEVRFQDPRSAPVKVVRGPSREPTRSTVAALEVLSFGPGGAQKVTVARGATGGEPSRAMQAEVITFAGPSRGSVTVFRGITGQEFTADLFAPAEDGELDRIAFAVDGVESGHGAELAMWRPRLEGPQGPMQVSLAAALDVGGGDRFDLRQNRLMGRAYLAQMFRRYGNWADAHAAYNWGPRNLDVWIATGRSADRRPIGVVRYVARVLREAMVDSR